jgi:hypothetical protein
MASIHLFVVVILLLGISSANVLPLDSLELPLESSELPSDTCAIQGDSGCNISCLTESGLNGICDDDTCVCYAYLENGVCVTAGDTAACQALCEDYDGYDCIDGTETCVCTND